MKYQHFQDKIKSVLIKTCSTEIKLAHLLSPVFEYVFSFHSRLYFHLSYFSMLEEFRLVAVWKIPSKSYHYSQEDFKFMTYKSQQDAFPKLKTLLQDYIT